MKRKYYIDRIKSIGIFLIVLGHFPITNHSLHNWIFSFHVPLFFFISGYLHKVVPFNKAFLQKNLYSLILVTVPYFIIERIFTFIQNYFFYPDKCTVQDLIIAPFKNYITGSSCMGVMWFVVALFLMRIAFNAMIQVFKHYNEWITLTLFTFISIIVYYSEFRINYYQLTSALLTMPIYCLGFLIKKKQIPEWYIKQTNIITKLSTSLILLLLSILFISIFTSINLNALKVGNNIFTFYLQSIIGILFIFSISTSNKRAHQFIINISNGTLVILGLHMMFIQLIKLIYKKNFHITVPPPYMDTYSAIMASFIIIVCVYPVLVWILNNKIIVIRLLAGKA